MMKTYQLSNKGPYGSSIKIAPLTTEEVKNQNNCFEVAGSADEPVEPENVLPDLTDFKVMTQLEVYNIPLNYLFFFSCSEKMSWMVSPVKSGNPLQKRVENPTNTLYGLKKR